MAFANPPTTKLKPRINADLRGLSISYEILFHNKLENRLLKNMHKKQEDEGLYHREHEFLFATACPERSRTGSETISKIPTPRESLVNNQQSIPRPTDSSRELKKKRLMQRFT
jgi:hypothetical protein